MKVLLWCGLLLAIAGADYAVAADPPLRFAQAQIQQQVPNIGACLVNCDNQANLCNNNCARSAGSVSAGSSATSGTSTPAPAGSAINPICMGNCTSQQLACRQTCTR